MTELITAASAVLVALVTGVLTVWAGRRKAQSDVQASLNSGFQILVSELQQERTELTRIIADQAQRITALEAEVNRLRAEMRRSERFLAERGISLPAPPNQ